jgi:glycosyltransferase involved in cell wall biosynthesis
MATITASMNLPLVTVLLTARDDVARIGATLEDVLGQAYPAEAIEVVAVDDGSTDGTAALLDGLAVRLPDRVRVFHQPRAGAAAALDRALAEARGELLAPLTAGDRWPRHRLSAQVGLLERRPEVGLVYSQLLPRGGEQVGPALWPAELEVDPPRGRPVGRLLAEECIAPSSMLVRASLMEQIAPIPQQIPRAPWWLAVRAATVSELEWLPEAPEAHPPAAQPRPLAAGDRVALLRETLAFQRWFLRRTTSESPFLDELHDVWAAFTGAARRLLAIAEDPFAEVVRVSDAERADALRLLADAGAAIARGDARPGLALAARAAATDPWCQPARTLLSEAFAARPRRAASDPLAGARRFVTLAFADELLRDPRLLAAYADHFDGHADATLAIDASGLMPAAAEQALGRLVAALGLDADDTAHLLAVLGPIDAAVRERLPAAVDALLTRAPRPEPAAPAYDADAAGALRAFAARACAA